MSASRCSRCRKPLDTDLSSGEPVFAIRHEGGQQVRMHTKCAKAHDEAHDRDLLRDQREFMRDHISTDMVVLAEDQL